MEQYIKLGSKVLMIANVLLIAIACLYVYNRDYWGYSYISMKNKKGIASKCYVNDKGLFCNDKGQVIAVKQFGKR